VATGERHGLAVLTGENRLRVFRIDGTGTRQYDLRNPVDKKPYDLILGQGPTAGATLATADFRFGGLTVPGDAVAFDPGGAPISPSDAKPLDFGRVDVASGHLARSVCLEPATGRVTIP
jgi:hypothetical protein